MILADLGTSTVGVELVQSYLESVKSVSIVPLTVSVSCGPVVDC